ncbi:MAG: hypothetical protein K8R90_03235 [Candidatus Cloacimonetes bacterium]|nr:hypothetical protein [Candidatus Cloacimonadota bacterium]
MNLDKHTTDERRHGPDILVKTITWLSVLGWLLMIITLFVYGSARPDSIRLKFWPLVNEMNRIWNTELTTIVLYFLICNFSLGIIGLLLNTRRHKRKTDNYSLPLMLLTLMAASGILIVVLGFAF